jgi:hypothetical protein
MFSVTHVIIANAMQIYIYWTILLLSCSRQFIIIIVSATIDSLISSRMHATAVVLNHYQISDKCCVKLIEVCW